jgi:hypothetical protein
MLLRLDNEYTVSGIRCVISMLPTIDYVDDYSSNNSNHHHHKRPELGPLVRSVSRVTATHASVSSVSRLFSFLVDCSGVILKGFCFVAFFAVVEASSVCINLS